MKYFLFVFITTLNLYALDFKVASYNVENFFDLHYDKTEYKEYKPNTKSWNKNAYTRKLQNISKVIQDLDADILALQEIESQRVLDAIVEKNPYYKYTKFLKNKNSAIGLALLSKFPIVKSDNVIVDKYDKYARDILKVTVSIENKPLLLYVNHWRSKKAKESQRIKYALALKKNIEKLDEFEDYIILGDLNSNYNEYQTFKYDKKLNDTFNITGINQILNTTTDENFIHKNTLFQYDFKVHFNTWLEVESYNRFSAKFKQHNNTPDNIILSKGLFDNRNISYINKSFNVFKPKYLYNKNKIIRWNKSKKTGYSDHLPIFALFSTTTQKYNFQDTKTVATENINSIDHLYNIEQISNYLLKDVIVIYIAKNVAIIKQKKDRKAILVFGSTINSLQLGYKYNFRVDKIDTYFGLKEIIQISNIIKKEKIDNFEEYYIDGNSIDLKDTQYLNNIVYNLKGIYTKNYLYFGTKKIRLYFKKGIKKPEDKTKILITSGHLSIYKSSIQIVLHKESDFIQY